ncbi:hypothetical protein DNH61_15625 [Paenibacillus sambharensis]|uniref:Uncharacterized protein n=1 Tax=Paenibacillus sambharensis TaxID=1803190 RepID=A0A2W1L7X6_9BACL|nr:hypothetical protein [Paenibacillus sambharensis]PZD95063.1 hypothetical protein DNH61_15625 [Paenibacillus sambharensis]
MLESLMTYAAVLFGILIAVWGVVAYLRVTKSSRLTQRPNDIEGMPAAAKRMESPVPSLPAREKRDKDSATG